MSWSAKVTTTSTLRGDAGLVMRSPLEASKKRRLRADDAPDCGCSELVSLCDDIVGVPHVFVILGCGCMWVNRRCCSLLEVREKDRHARRKVT